MKKRLLVLAVLALAASAWAVSPTIGGIETVEPLQGGGASFIPTDTLKYHTIHRDGRVFYITPPRLYSATRFTPPYTGKIDSVYLFVMVSRAMTTPVDTIFFYLDTTTTQRQPGRALAAYTFSFTSGGRGAYGVKLRFGSPFQITNGVDFWAGYMGLVGTARTDTMFNCMDTSITTAGDRQMVATSRVTPLPSDWARCDSSGIPYDWGISLFANTGSGVELLTPGGPVSLSPKLYPASPNPFRGSGEIAFDLPKSARVELAIHDLSGRLVRTLVVGERNAGHHAVRWDGKDAIGQTVASGVYLYTLRAGSLSTTRSVVVVR